MALSRIWQAGNFMRHAMSSFPQVDEVAWVQRFEIINLIQYKVASEFYGIMWWAYQTLAIMQQDTAGRVATGGTYTNATKTLALTGLSSSFIPNDVGKLITFTDGTSMYAGFIGAWISTTSVQVTGNDLPVVDIAVLTSTIMVPTVVMSDSLSLAGINMMRTGEQVNLDLQSTSTDALEAVALESLRFFRSLSAQNRNRIVYAPSGDRLLLMKGSAVSSYGTMVLAYPRAPIPVVQDTDYLDILDGGMVNMAMLLLKKTLNDKFYHEKRDFAAEGRVILEDIYKNHEQVMKTQTIQEKMLMLM